MSYQPCGTDFHMRKRFRVSRKLIIKSTVMTRYARGSPNTKNLLKIEENKPAILAWKIRIKAKNIYPNLLTSPRFPSQMLHFVAEFPCWSSVAKILMIFPAPLLAGPDDRCPTGAAGPQVPDVIKPTGWTMNLSSRCSFLRCFRGSACLWWRSSIRWC